MMITLKDIKSWEPCESGWETLLKSLGKTEADDTVVTFSQVLSSNGSSDIGWLLRKFAKNKASESQKLALKNWALERARSVEAYADNPPAVKDYNDVTEAFLDGRITREVFQVKRFYASASAVADAAASAAYAVYATNAADAAAAAGYAAAASAAYAADNAAALKEAYARLDDLLWKEGAPND